MAVPVTVVVPNYNGARFLGAALDSLLAQTFEDFFLVVLDNRSTDGSLQVAESRRDQRLRIVRSDIHVSMAENWNRAAALADTASFVLAHADDVYEPDYLAVMIPLIEAHPRAFIAHSRVQSIDEDGRPYEAPQEAFKDLSWPATDTYERPAAEEFALLRRGNYILAPSAIYRTAAFRRIGAFSPAYQFVTDWEYWLRGLLAGYTITGTRRRLVHYRRHRQSGTQAHQASLRRYEEELGLSLWAAREGHAGGLTPSGAPDLSLVRNTLLSDFAGRLAQGDRGGARALLEFARERIPGFRGSARHGLMAGGLLVGRLGWAMFKKAEAAYIAHRRRRAGSATGHH